ncbi:hypothetical protein BGW38_003294 [Lunasporangiospora selenospora]|uniref:ADF-H domain-containing protein n=1 Tax=Lunasporangiospora selenospora TaxID=979761 RepID=A0A9P6FQW2_9FUNG|nr:hypothetical protein BGW38_003294 [Lunasporangiospora selenospora]
MSTICDIDPELIKKIETLRFAKRSQGNAAIICKIDKNKLVIEEDENEDSISIEELAELLPDNAPRYVILSFELNHDDGRVSYPLVFIFYSPRGTRPELNILYTAARNHFQTQAQLGKVLEVYETETLTEGWLREKLK